VAQLLTNIVEELEPIHHLLREHIHHQQMYQEPTQLQPIHHLLLEHIHHLSLQEPMIHQCHQLPLLDKVYQEPTLVAQLLTHIVEELELFHHLLLEHIHHLSLQEPMILQCHQLLLEHIHNLSLQEPMILQCHQLPLLDKVNQEPTLVAQPLTNTVVLWEPKEPILVVIMALITVEMSQMLTKVFQEPSLVESMVLHTAVVLVLILQLLCHSLMMILPKNELE
jgi:hypothetical protein